MKPLELAERFRREFSAEPQISYAPGRVNLIGEHTDYNDGFVLPVAIELATRIAFSPRSDTQLVLRSTHFKETFRIDLTNPPPERAGIWSDYVLGVALSLVERGYRLPGANFLIAGEIPIGAGLSSSAAVEVAAALAFLALLDTKLDPVEVAKLCHRAENSFVGARVGIMDQFVSCLGRQGHALLLDCRSLDYELVPIGEGVKLVICNTMVKHELAGGEYNRRREESDEGVRILAGFYPAIRALRDVSVEQLEARAGSLAPVIYNRCRHVVEENRRVLRAGECFRSLDWIGVGALMGASHQSLRDLYEVSCRELDLMVEAAEGLPGCYGARMTGGGFGGSTVNLVDSGQVRNFSESVADRYRRETGTLPAIYVCSPADGAGMELKLTPA